MREPKSERDTFARAKYINARPKNDNGAFVTGQSGLVLLSLDQVLEAVDNAVRNAIGDSVPRLLDREKLAERLGCSVTTVDMLRREKGMPHLRVGESPRFIYDDVVAWLHEQPRESA